MKKSVPVVVALVALAVAAALFLARGRDAASAKKEGLIFHQSGRDARSPGQDALEVGKL